MSIDLTTLKQILPNAQGDVIYALLLLACAGISLARRAAARRFRFHILANATDGAVGLAITYVVVDHPLMVLCSLSVVVGHLVLYRIVKDAELLADISFYGTFAYLATLRCQHFVGLPRLAFVTNAIQLIVTLRVIGLSYEIADSRKAKKKDAMDGKQRTIKEPSSWQTFNYLYNFTGLFTGPYYTYQTYCDSLRVSERLDLPIKRLVLGKIRTLLWSLPLLIILSAIDPVERLRSEKLNDYSQIILSIWSGVAFVYLRMRIYSAWMVAESICIFSGIGLYPSSCRSEPGHGPKDTTELEKKLSGTEEIDFDAETISNLDIPSVEYSDGFRSGMRAWNRSVQYWLATYVYRRTRRSIRMPYTMLVSAFWHGIHPGYFLSFLTIPICTAAEDLVFRVFDERDGQRPFLFSIVWSFIRTRGFEMMACGFLLLNWEDTVRLWTKSCWWLHCLMVLVIVGSKSYLTFVREKRPKRAETKSDKQEQQRPKSE